MPTDAGGHFFFEQPALVFRRLEFSDAQNSAAGSMKPICFSKRRTGFGDLFVWPPDAADSTKTRSKTRRSESVKTAAGLPSVKEPLARWLDGNSVDKSIRLNPNNYMALVEKDEILIDINRYSD